MKYIKFALLVFASLVISLNLSAKEEKYGNVTLRSIGVGNIHKTQVQQRVVIPNNTYTGYYRTYGLQETQRTTVDYQQHVAVKPYGFTAYDNTPFAESAITTTRTMYSFGGGEDPNHPGVPVGDAIPFLVLLAAVYVFVRNKE